MRDTTAFYMVGGQVSIDFINTTVVEHGTPKDLLKSLADFAAWAAATQVLSEGQADRLIAEWAGRPEAEAALAHIHSFRSTLRQMIAGLACGERASASAVAAINGELHNKSGVVEVRRTERGFAKLFRAEVQEPRHLLAPIAESAADLLCYGNMAYLKKCEGAECILYFYDTTKNHSRRWCSMAGCGNRAKAAAFYERQRAKAQGDKHQAQQ